MLILPLQTRSTVAHWAQWNVYQPPFRSLPASSWKQPGLVSLVCVPLDFSHSACFLLGLVRHRPTCPLVCDSRRKLLRGSPQFTAPGAQQAHADADGVRFKIERCLTLPSRAALTWRGNRNANSYLTCTLSASSSVLLNSP